MRQILRHPTNHCYGCPLSKDPKHFTTYIPTDVYYSDVQRDGKTPIVDVLIVGEPPSISEDRIGIPFAGASGADLKEALQKAGVDNYAVTHCVRCRGTDTSGKHRDPSVEVVAACRNYLLRDIEVLQPKVVVLAGTLPVRMLGKDPSWKGKTAHVLKGRIYKQDSGPTQLVTINPGYYVRSENAVERRRFFRNILAIRRILTGKETRWSRPGEVKLLTTLPEIDECLDYFRRGCTSPIAMDTETKNLNMVAHNKLATVQLSSDMDLAYVIPVDHWDTPFKDKKDRIHIKKKLNRLFSDPDTLFPFWVMHNYPFDVHKVLRHLKVKKQPPKLVIDTQFLAYIQDENQAGSEDSGDTAGGGGYNAFRLKDLARELLGFYEYDTNLSDAMAARSGANGGSLWNLELDPLSTYGGTDAYVTLRLFHYYRRWLDRQGYSQALKFARRWYGRTAYPLMKMSENGFYQDREQLSYLKSPESPIISRLQELPKLIYATKEAKSANQILLDSDSRTKGMRPLFGKKPWSLDISKKKHRVHLFVDACGLEPLSSGKDGTPSINKGFFDHYKGHPIIDLYKEYSGLYKLSTSYLNSLESLLVSKPDNQFDSRIRAAFHLIRTVTGRASCLPEGTPIATGRGILRIEDVVAGDLVQTHKGPAEVSSSFYSGKKEVLRFQLEGGRSLECTGNHTVFVNGKWTLAKDIVVGDDLCHCSVEGPDVSLPVSDITGFPSSLLSSLAGRRYFLDSLFDGSTSYRTPDSEFAESVGTLLSSVGEDYSLSTASGLVIICRQGETPPRALRVQGIEHAGVQRVYDLTVPSAEAFLVNGILCHNSSNPNLQQLPKGKKWTAKAHIRSLYGAPLGYMLLEADYGQAEVRWWAQISGDKEYAALFHEMKNLRDLYKSTGDLDIGAKVEAEADIHKKVAGIMFKKSVYDVTPDDRTRAKSLCFACIFGQHFKTLAALLGIKPEEALDLQGTFLNEFERAGGWLTEIEVQARRTGVVSTPMGRVRHLADVYARNEGAGDRRARNSPIQAASSDTTALAAWRIQMAIERDSLPIKMVNCVHDAITLELPLDFSLLRRAVGLMNECMVNVDEFLKEEFEIDMIVPMEIDFDLGVRWGHLLGFDGVDANLRPLFDQCVAWDRRLASGEAWHTIANEEWPVPKAA